MVTTKKTISEKDGSEVVEEIQPQKPQKKSQMVKVLVSVYRVNDKIISALGIPTADAWVSHRFQKNKLQSQDLFMLTTTIKNHEPFNKLDSYKPVIEQILNDKVQEIILPSTKANQLQNISIFTHEILNIGIELFS
jgi:hypothetical protein